MAEIVGIVSGTITLAEATQKIGGAILALRRLWNNIHDASNYVNSLLDQLGLVHSVLAGMEAEISSDHTTGNASTAMQLSAEFCNKAVLSLETLVNKLNQKVEDKNRFRRNKARLKVVIEQDEIQHLERKMQGALQLLGIAQQTYLMVLVRQQPSLVAAQVNAVAIHQDCKELPPPSSPEPVPNTPTGKAAIEHRQKSRPFLPWVYSHFLGSYTSRPSGVKGSKPSVTPEEIYYARVQLPPWLSQRVWDFWVERAHNGWTYSFRSWNTKPSGSGIFAAAFNGNVSSLVEMLENGTGSLYDRTTDGWTLLHYAASAGNRETFSYLVQNGLGIEDINEYGRSPIAKLCSWINRQTCDIVDMHRVLKSTTILTDAAISVFYPELSPKGIHVSNLDHFIWSIPGILDLVSDEFHLAPLSSRYQSIDWTWVHPKVLLDVLLREKITNPAMIRRQLFGQWKSSIEWLAQEYFNAATRSFSRENLVSPWSLGTGEDWRNLTRWLLRGVDVEELVQICPKTYKPTPLVKSLMLCEFTLPSSIIELREIRYALSKALRCWLEDLQSVGVDLRIYGRRQKKMFKADERLRFARWRELTFNNAETRGKSIFLSSGPILAELKTGPDPNDWELIWDLYGEAYAGEFFEWAERGRPLMPGSWNEDDIF